MKTAVIYARYSSDSQTEQSIEGQLRVCQDYAKNNDILIVDTYIDRAMTGTNDLRPDFQRMIKDSGKRQWQFVIVYKLDRFSRNKFESVVHKKALKDNGVSILSAMENLTDSPEGRMLETILEGFNQYFSEELTQKVNRGLKESWRKGNSTGGRDVFGYDRVDKKYVVNEYESEIVAQAFSMYAQGYMAVAIAKQFQALGYRRKNGELISQEYLYTILHNRCYTGVVEHQGELYDNIFPRIVPDDVWNKVNAIHEENKIAPSRKKEIFDYILSGKLICGACKHKMGGESGTSRTGDIHYYYICLSRRKKRGKCDMKAVRKQYLEDAVINATVALLARDDVIHQTAQGIFRIHQNESADNTTLRLIEQKRREALKAQANLIRAIEQGIITEATKTRLVELETQISQYDVNIAKEKSRNHMFLTVEEIEQYLRQFVFDNPTDIKVRKLLVNAFIREVILYEDRIVITYNFTDSPEHIKFTKEHIADTEKQIENAAQSAFHTPAGSYISRDGAPQQKGHPCGAPFVVAWVVRRGPATRRNVFGLTGRARSRAEMAVFACKTRALPARASPVSRRRRDHLNVLLPAPNRENPNIVIFMACSDFLFSSSIRISKARKARVKRSPRLLLYSENVKCQKMFK